jgi:hypothetical protein
MAVIRPDGTGNREILSAARNYFENRSAIWRSPNSLIFITPAGTTSLLEVDTGKVTPLTTKPIEDFPWLIDSSLSWAASGDATFAPYDSERRQIPDRTALEGCQAYFTFGGQFGFWVAAPGGPLRWIHLDTKETGTLLRKSDPLLPSTSGYLYFPMISSDRRLLAFGASDNKHSHLDSDYVSFVAEISPETLTVLKAPLRVTNNQATDRFPDVYQSPLPLGSHYGEAPFRWRFSPPGEEEFAWNYGDGSESTGVSAEHLYEQPGRYKVVASKGKLQLQGRVEVHPAAAPKPLSTQLLEDGLQIAIVFDEKIRIDELSAHLETGIDIQEWKLDRGDTRLRLQLAEPIRQPDRLELTNILDRAQRPNRMSTISLEVEPPHWPSNREGLVFVWQTGNSPNLLFDQGLQADTAVQLGPRGFARLDSSFSLLPSGGSFVADDASMHRIRQGCQRTNELSLELTVRPPTGIRESAVLMTAAGRGWSNFTLSQIGHRLVFEIRNGGKGSEGLARIDLMKLPARASSHVVVSYSSGRLVAYLNGSQVLSIDSVQGGFFHWRARPLTIGSDWNEKRPWTGGLEGLALYNRILDPEEVRENHRRYRAMIENRPPIEAWTVDATLVQCSVRPVLDDIAPYRDALMTCEYSVESDTTSFDLGSSLRVAQWAILDGQDVGTTEIAAVAKLGLTRFRDNPQLESQVLSDTLDRLRQFPLFYSSRP